VREQLRGVSLSHLEIEVVSDRHFIIWGPIGSKHRPVAEETAVI
jgi:hypothetical protein